MSVTWSLSDSGAEHAYPGLHWTRTETGMQTLCGRYRLDKQVDRLKMPPTRSRVIYNAWFGDEHLHGVLMLHDTIEGRQRCVEYLQEGCEIHLQGAR